MTHLPFYLNHHNDRMTTQSQPEPFNIDIPASALAALKSKLDSTIFPDELEAAGWDYGAPLSETRRLVLRWKGDEKQGKGDGKDSEAFDWKKAERQLNEDFPQFTRDIEVEGHGTLNIHFIHKKSVAEAEGDETEEVIPLLFVHGCKANSQETKVVQLILNWDVVCY